MGYNCFAKLTFLFVLVKNYTKKSWATSRQPNQITIKTCNTIRSESVMFMCWFSNVYILLPITFLLVSCAQHVRGICLYVCLEKPPSYLGTYTNSRYHALFQKLLMSNNFHSKDDHYLRP